MAAVLLPGVVSFGDGVRCCSLRGRRAEAHHRRRVRGCTYNFGPGVYAQSSALATRSSRASQRAYYLVYYVTPCASFWPGAAFNASTGYQIVCMIDPRAARARSLARGRNGTGAPRRPSCIPRPRDPPAARSRDRSRAPAVPLSVFCLAFQCDSRGATTRPDRVVLAIAEAPRSTDRVPLPVRIAHACRTRAIDQRASACAG